jgi:hypothetical protein
MKSSTAIIDAGVNCDRTQKFKRIFVHFSPEFVTSVMGPPRRLKLC